MHFIACYLSAPHLATPLLIPLLPLPAATLNLTALNATSRHCSCKFCRAVSSQIRVDTAPVKVRGRARADFAKLDSVDFYTRAGPLGHVDFRQPGDSKVNKGAAWLDLHMFCFSTANEWRLHLALSLIIGVR
jgi:hypothetical protein